MKQGIVIFRLNRWVAAKTATHNYVMKVDAERQKKKEQTYRHLVDIMINVLW